MPDIVTAPESRSARNVFRSRRASIVAHFVVALLLAPLGTVAASAQGAVVTIQQVSSGRCVTAYNTQANDYGVVTRPCAQYDTAQLWRMINYGSGGIAFEQVSTGRYLDAHEIESLDFRLVTRPAQNNNTQRWFVTTPGGATPGQRLPGLAVAPAGATPAQRLPGLAVAPGAMTSDRGQIIRMASNGRYVDAHEYAGMDFAVVTRPAQNNDTQLWRITVVDPGP